MKAAAYDRYGPPEVLELKEIPKPVPEENEVLIKVCASTATLYDCWVRSATAPPGFGLMSRLSSGLFKPKLQVLGTDLAGEIEAAGPQVKRFRPGDQVYAFLGEGMGGYAEYRCLAEDTALALKPNNMTFQEAAAVPQGGQRMYYRAFILGHYRYRRKQAVDTLPRSARGCRPQVFEAQGSLGRKRTEENIQEYHHLRR